MYSCKENKFYKKSYTLHLRDMKFKNKKVIKPYETQIKHTTKPNKPLPKNINDQLLLEQ